MHLMDYQDSAMMYAAYPNEARILYPLLALPEEVGEFTGKVAKLIRKDQTGERSSGLGNGWMVLSMEDHDALMAEAGDILWQLTALCEGMGWSLEDIAQGNLDKLEARKAKGTIIGEGDNR